MKREDTVITVNRWLVRNDLTDIEYLGSPSKDTKKINEFIQSNLEWTKYKDHELVNEYCWVVKNNMCRGIEPKLKKYIIEHAKEYSKYRNEYGYQPRATKKNHIKPPKGASGEDA